MNTCPFCKSDPSPKPAASVPDKVDRPIGLFRRTWRGMQWLFPATFLVLMPKCPLCVAAYVALFTGVGISVSTARWIQILMLALCAISLAYLAIRFCRGRFKLSGWS